MSAFNPRKFTQPDTLRTIAPERLTAFLLPWREYVERRDARLPDGGDAFDYEALSRVLLTPDGDLPTDMVDALYYVHETASHEDMDALLDIAEKRKLLIEHDPYQELEIRKASDIFAGLSSRGQSLKAGGSLVAAAFRVKFADSPKERLITVRPPGNAKYERNEDSEIVERWLTLRGFMLRPKAANDVDETRSTALEGAA